LTSQLDEDLTVVILAHPVKSHPSLELVLATFDSLKHLNLSSKTKIIISHDRPKNSLEQERVVAFNLYLTKLTEYFSKKPNVLITTTKHHAFLSGNIAHALQFVDTKYLLLMQHDLAFRTSINLRGLLWAMSENDEIKHIRFNKRPNYVKEGWDFYLKSRLDFIEEKVFQTPKGNVSLFRTLAWSDQNHLTTLDYYKNLVLPFCGSFKVYPEDILNPFTRRKLFSIFGNYVYGDLQFEAALDDLDGSKGRWDEMSGPDNFLRRVKMSLHYRRNKWKILKYLLAQD